ncbi:MSMEG_4193 family putative phosphomutase [Curtobacterium ammoniigenes]|uniref:MSMEG_4193 family putative phosphomutase n=1 Tax=Curtobacterium ammoniigenes TaxID=395387 RepID=UPI00082E3DB8|nr:MSMEG_4193 family putative phosphomutase [Curtobacterium ammoniigenes]
MGTVILVRHGRTSANASGILAGRAGGVRLDEVGVQQADRVAERIAAIPLAGIVSSPLGRCRDTARRIARSQREPAAVSIDRALTECDYGSWQGRPLRELTSEPLWPTIQRQPSAVTFPGGESMASMQLRAVSAIRRLDAAFEAKAGPHAVWVAVSHGDIIKSILADALGMHLDLFQRIMVGPASASIVHYGATQPDVLAMNTETGDLGWLAKQAEVTQETQVGGGAGHSGPATPARPDADPQPADGYFRASDQGGS